MRNSVLYPDADKALRLGMIMLATGVLAVGSVLILATAPSRSHDGQRLTGDIRGLDGLEPTSGAVYLLDPVRGGISNIGRFTWDGTAGSMDLTLPPGPWPPADGQDARLEALFWHPVYPTYGPYFSFVHDADMQQRLGAILREAGRDPAMRERLQGILTDAGMALTGDVGPQLRALTADPAVRDQLVEIGTDQVIRLLLDRFDRELPEAWRGQVDDRSLTAAVSAVLLERAGDWPWEEWLEEVFADPAMQEQLTGLALAAEPYVRASLDELLWMPVPAGGDRAPNVRLLWVARRTLFGPREPAIALIPGEAGAVWREGEPLTVTEVRRW